MPQTESMTALVKARQIDHRIAKQLIPNPGAFDVEAQLMHVREHENLRTRLAVHERRTCFPVAAGRAVRPVNADASEIFVRAFFHRNRSVRFTLPAFERPLREFAVSRLAFGLAGKFGRAVVNPPRVLFCARRSGYDCREEQDHDDYAAPDAARYAVGRPALGVRPIPVYGDHGRYFTPCSESGLVSVKIGNVFRKVLVANRGEIALRIIRTLREMGIRSVAVYSDADRKSLHVRKADEASHIGPSPSSESYLNIDRIVGAARKHGAEAIHPGYGFLSENAHFAKACEDAGMVFIGPSPNSIASMGSKTEARRIAKQAGAPVVPGSEEGLSSAEKAEDFARSIGFPVMLKAVAGGGGKGMRRVDRAAELAPAFETASSEALRAFGDGRIYLEKLVENSRHIEIQVLGDRYGAMVHLGERECSVQRRHQKVIEESPSPLVAQSPAMRERMGEAAIRAASAAGYYNAGTVEFLADNSGQFYFLEMNTRLQVEHPVTELVTGLDLVRLQVEIADGARLPFSQDQIPLRGSSIECRIYAEDPANNFFPSPGKITHLAEPSGPGVRVDSGVYPGWTVPLEYDPMLAKLIVWCDTRDHAIERMLRALNEYHVGGIRSNIQLFQTILRDSDFRAGNLHTGYLDQVLRNPTKAEPPPAELARLAALVASAQIRDDGAELRQDNRGGWVMTGRADLLR